MRVCDLLAADNIVVRPPWATFEEAVHGLTGCLVASGHLPAELHETAVSAICEREQVADTAIVEINVSIPHARLAGVRGVVSALAASPTAVYSGMAGVPICVMALVISPPEMAAQHLSALSALSMLLQSERVRRELCTAADGGEALEILRRYEGAP